jgi:hypothetical protein
MRWKDQDDPGGLVGGESEGEDRIVDMAIAEAAAMPALANKILPALFISRCLRPLIKPGQLLRRCERASLRVGGFGESSPLEPIPVTFSHTPHAQRSLHILGY